MKIRIANNIDTVDGGMEIGPEEVGGKMGIETASRLSQDGIIIAADIFKKYPEIKQVTLDTMTDEDRNMLEMAEKKGGMA